MKKIINLFIFTFFSFLSLIACRKNGDIPTPIADFISEHSFAISQDALNAIYDVVYEEISKNPALNGLTGSGNSVGTCPIVTFTPRDSAVNKPATLTLDFGTGCTTRQGYKVSGLITITTTSNRVNQTGATMTITLANVVANGVSVSGSLVATATAVNGQAQQNLTIQGTNLVVKYDSKTTTFNTLTATRMMVAGQATTLQTSGKDAVKDDAFDITINGNGTNAEGKNFTITTITALRRDATCNWIATGKVELKAGIAPAAKVDFGTGTCDNIVTLSVGSETKTVNLPTR